MNCKTAICIGAMAVGLAMAPNPAPAFAKEGPMTELSVKAESIYGRAAKADPIISADARAAEAEAKANAPLISDRQIYSWLGFHPAEEKQILPVAETQKMARSLAAQADSLSEKARFLYFKADSIRQISERMEAVDVASRKAEQSPASLSDFVDKHPAVSVVVGLIVVCGCLIGMMSMFAKA